MDPTLAKQLLDRGEITQDTYNAMVNGVGVSAAPLSSQPPTQFGPPPPPQDMAPPNAFVAPLPNGPLSNPSNSIQTSVDMNGKPVGGNGITYVSPPPPSAPKDPYAGSSEDPKLFKPDGTPIPKPPVKKNAGDTLLDSQVQIGNNKIGIVGKEQESVAREGAAFSAGLKAAADEQLSQATDNNAQMKADEGYKLAAMDRAQKFNDSSLARAKEISNMKVDPDRAWKNLNGAQNMLLLIAGALNGAAGNHSTMDMMNKTVDNDIASQQASIQNKKDGWEMEKNVAAREAAKDNDWLNYRQTKRIEGLGVLKLKLQGIADGTKSDQVREQANQQILGLDRQIEETKLGIAGNVYQNAKTKEQAAAQAAAAQSAQHSAQIAKVQALTEKLVLGDANNAPMAPDQARLVAQQTIFGANSGGSSSVPTVGARTSKEQAKDIGERLVVVDGKEQLATSKEAATNFREFATIQPEAKRLVAEMKLALANNDPAKYEAARGKLIEVMPPIYGYKRGPTNTQAEHTFGPEVIPEYPHWYKPTVESTFNNTTRAADGSAHVGNNRVLDKLDDIDKTIDTVGTSLRAQTFGTGPGSKAEAAPVAKVGDVKFN